MEILAEVKAAGTKKTRPIVAGRVRNDYQTVLRCELNALGFRLDGLGPDPRPSLLEMESNDMKIRRVVYRS